MLKRILVVCLVSTVGHSVSFSVQGAERLRIPSSFNPVGSGARALGMGGSFIATADDATAASWNPSALVNLRNTEIALVYSATRLNEDLTFSEAPEANSGQSTSSNELNYFALSYPCAASQCGKNMVFSLNYQRLYDFSRDWAFSQDINSTLTQATQSNNIGFEGSLGAYGFAFAAQVTPTLSVGFTLNRWQESDWQSDFDIEVDGELFGDAFTENLQIREVNNFSGWNYNLGLLWQAYQKDEKKLTVGVVYKSEFDGDLSINNSENYTIVFPTDPDANNGYQDTGIIEQQTLTLPASFGIAFAMQWTDNLTTSIDVYRTNWSAFKLSDENGEAVSPISGESLDDVSIDDTTQIRAGLEYRIISQKATVNYVIPLRAGLFRDPVVADGKPENAYGVTLGTGIAMPNWVFDVAYQYRFGDDIGNSYLQALGFSQSVDEHQLYASVFYRF